MVLAELHPSRVYNICIYLEIGLETSDRRFNLGQYVEAERSNNKNQIVYYWSMVTSVCSLGFEYTYLLLTLCIMVR